MRSLSAALLSVLVAMPSAWAQSAAPFRVEPRALVHSLEDAFTAVADRVMPAAILDPHGYILTNEHVIENAHRITVRLSDFRKFMACLVGRDPKSELAMLKVDSADRPNEYLVLERPDRP